MPKTKRRRTDKDFESYAGNNDDDDVDNDGTESSANDTNSKNIVVLPGDNVTSFVETKDDTDSERHIGNYKRLFGTGIRYDSSTKQIHATIAGRLIIVNPPSRRQKQKTITLDHQQPQEQQQRVVCYVEPHRPTMGHKRRYRPMIHDRVIGIVVDRIGTSSGAIAGIGNNESTTAGSAAATAVTNSNNANDGSTSSAISGGGDIYRVDINASHYGIINNLHFMNASKRNKPILQRGQLIYCRLVEIRGIDIVLSCINGPYDVGIPHKDWTTNEGCYGIIGGSGRNSTGGGNSNNTNSYGTLCRISLQLARDLLLSPQQQHLIFNTSNTNGASIVIEELTRHSKKMPFEIAVGQNGYMYINSTKAEYIICIQNALFNSQVLTSDEQIRAMVRNLIFVVEKQIQQSLDRST